MSNFKAHQNGFWIKFPNGIVLSTQFGYGSYCEGHELFFEKCVKDKDGFNKIREDGCPNCELAVGTDREPCCLTAKMNLEVFKKDLGDSVKGYVSFEDWLLVLDWCRKQPPLGGNNA